MSTPAGDRIAMKKRWGDLGQAIRNARAAKGLSIRAAAAEADVNRELWGELEKGAAKAPRPETLGKIERFLGWRVGDIDAYLHGEELPGRSADEFLQKPWSEPELYVVTEVLVRTLQQQFPSLDASQFRESMQRATRDLIGRPKAGKSAGAPIELSVKRSEWEAYAARKGEVEEVDPSLHDD